MNAIVTPEVTLTLLAALAFWAALNDVREYQIPNRIVLAVAALYPVHVLVSAEPIAWGAAMIVAFVVLLAGMAAFFAGILGGGDAKLVAAIALWAGPAHIVEFLIVTALAGGVLSIVMSGPWRLGFAMSLNSVGQTGLRNVLIANFLPYGVAIAVGVLFLIARLLAV